MSSSIGSVESNKKTKKGWKVIFGRELKAYFTSPIPYVVYAVFFLIEGCMTFAAFFYARRADLRNFFYLLPYFFSVFIPPLTMRTISEENKTGSMETLVTLPVTTMDIVMGKYLSSLVLSAGLLVPTLFYVITCCIFGSPDIGVIVCSYIGAVLLAAAFVAIGIFASAVSKNQIVALVLGVAICAFLCFISMFSQLLPSGMVSFVSFISAQSHFESIGKGVIDTRDVIYFLSLVVLFFGCTVKVIEKARRN